MTSLTPAMDAALRADRIVVTLLIEADLPGGPLQLMFGTGAIQWGAKVFRDTSDIYGALAAIDAVEDGDDDEAPPFTFDLLPPTDAAAAAICNPLNQESDVYVWLAALDPVTMLLVPDPQLLGYFQWDIATLTPDAGTREVEVECVSAFDLLLEDDEGARLTDAFHQSIFPGELGCANVTGLTEPRYWGMATPRVTGTTVTSGSYGITDKLGGGDLPVYA